MFPVSELPQRDLQKFQQHTVYLYWDKQRHCVSGDQRHQLGFHQSCSERIFSVAWMTSLQGTHTVDIHQDFPFWLGTQNKIKTKQHRPSIFYFTASFETCVHPKFSKI